MPKQSKAEFVRKRSQPALVLFELNIGIEWAGIGRDAALALAQTPASGGWFRGTPKDKVARHIQELPKQAPWFRGVPQDKGAQGGI